VYDLVARPDQLKATELAPAMGEGTGILPGLPAVAGKPVHVGFDGGRLTSDAGILLLAAIEQRLGIADRLAACIEDPRDPDRVLHGLAEMIRYRALLIAAGYPDVVPQLLGELSRDVGLAAARRAVEQYAVWDGKSVSVIGIRITDRGHHLAVQQLLERVHPCNLAEAQSPGGRRWLRADRREIVRGAQSLYPYPAHPIVKGQPTSL
jgi:hypothetical protein